VNLLRNPKLLIPLALLGVVVIAAAILLLSRQSQNQRPSLTAGITAQPLPVTGTTSATLMAALTSAQTGVSFINQLSLENQVKFTYNGAGVAVGDYDGDGLIDIFFCNEEGADVLYRNKGNMQFEDATAAAGLDDVTAEGGFTIGAYFADIDNDGDLDLFVTNWKASNRLFENRGNGQFRDVTEDAGVTYAGGSTTATFADYDRDGDLDFFVATYRPTAIAIENETLRLQQTADGRMVVPAELQERIVILENENGPNSLRELGEKELLYRNNGDGTFSEVAAAAGIAGGYWGLSAIFSDVDDDGWPDLYVTNDFWSPDTFYHNNGNGTFSLIDPMMMQHTPWYSMGIDFGDINNDGYQDYFIGDMISRDHTLRLTQHGAMDMSPTPPEFAPQMMRNSLYLNNGDGSFSDIAWMADVAASDWTWTAKFADFDLDGFLDLLITNGMVRDLMDSDAAVQGEQILQTQGREAFMAFLEQYPTLDNPNVIFRNNGDLTFSEMSAQWGFNTAKVGNGASLADLDNDGDLDVVVNYMNDVAGVYRNDATASRLVVRLVGQTSNAQGIGAKVILTTDNGVQTRLVTASGGYLSNHQPVAVFGLGSAGLIRELRVEWPSGQVQTFPDTQSGVLQPNTLYTITEPTEAGTLNPAQIVETTATQFTERSQAAGVTGSHWESAFDDFAVQPLLPRKLSVLGPGITWGDANADGLDDLYMPGAFGQAGLLYHNQGNGLFVPVASGNVASEEEMAGLWWYAGLAAAPDLLLSYSSVESGQSPDRVGARLVADETGFLAEDPNWQDQSNASSGALAAADFDRDGDVDLFVGGRVMPGQWPLAASSKLYRNETGQLVDVTAQVAPGLNNLGMVTGAIWLDVDNDADSDLLLATEWGPVHLFRNDNGTLVQSTQEAGLQTWLGLWTGLTAGDFDRDGDMDFAAANLGLNTPYQASLEQPLVLYAGDMDGNGTLDLVETVWVDGFLRPMRERRMVGQTMPFVLEAFPTFRGYAEATIDQIYGARLAGVGSYAAATLAHSLFTNDGSGRFTATPLPIAAQATAAYGITTADFDNDGRDDLYLVGNFHGADHEIMAYSGGVSYWLKGNGDGTFANVPTAQSGLFVPYEGRGLAVSDYDQNGWVDVAVGLNNHAPLLFHNGGVSGHTGLRVRLAGPVSNPTGVGARITVTLPDGSSSSREVHAGNGYLSQDSATLVFGLGTQAQATVTVRWPDGHVTTHQGTAGQLLMAAP
jgi:hypothetical protein